MKRIDEVRGRYREEALARGVNPRDVDVLLGDLTGRSLAWVIGHGDERIDDERLAAMLARRYAGEPLQYIRGKADFYSREFYVDDRVLIPRPETELLVEAAIDRAARGARVIDIGTGSGCIAISIERERPDLRVFAVDRSLEALAVARFNKSRLSSNVHLAASDVLSGVRGGFDVVVSNPPYIPQREIDSLQVEVREHEPRGALTPGPKGTEVIERILDQRAGRLVILEIGFGQEQAVRELAEAKQYVVEDVIDDLAAIPRVVVLSAG